MINWLLRNKELYTQFLLDEIDITELKVLYLQNI